MVLKGGGEAAEGGGARERILGDGEGLLDGVLGLDFAVGHRAAHEDGGRIGGHLGHDLGQVGELARHREQVDAAAGGQVVGHRVLDDLEQLVRPVGGADGELVQQLRPLRPRRPVEPAFLKAARGRPVEPAFLLALASGLKVSAKARDVTKEGALM